MSWPNASQSASGYTCASCGTWVPANTLHQCTSIIKADPTWMLIQALNAATAELSRIAVALEKAGEKS